MTSLTLRRSAGTAVIAMVVAAVALLLFTTATLGTVLENDRFWSTVAVAGIGGFLGGLFFGEGRVAGR